jgi:hypothetical protein
MEELAHDLLAIGNRSCGSWGPAMWRSSRTASGHGDRDEGHAHHHWTRSASGCQGWCCRYGTTSRSTPGSSRMHGAPKCARAATCPRSVLVWPTASPGPKTMTGHFSMTCGIACEQRACPTLPRPQLTTLAHKKPSSLAPSSACVPSRRQLPAFMPSVRMPSSSRLAA